MIGELQNSSLRQSHRRQNFAAAVVAGGALAFLYYNFQPAEADEAHNVSATKVSSLVHSLPDTRIRKSFSSTDMETHVPKPKEMEQPSSTDPQLSEISDRYAILFSISQLQRGIEKLESAPSYTTIFERVERIDGELKDQQQIELKLRHSPFSVYMKWLNGDKGRELLYADNENEGRMLVKLGGLKGRFIPTLRLDPMGTQAQAETRHPITRAGLVNLAKQLIEHRQRDLESGHYPRCTVEEGHEFDGRPCTKMIIEYARKEHSSLYRKSITMIDSELSLPVYVRNYTWADQNTVDEEQETLIECYAYTKIQIEKQLANAVWQHDNPEYRFKR
ncbi:MAG: DUF1571 domain-containing protein [Planctomycetaceae bacterium]|nr:DUF1571 domain-containing protein [Planctomycetaceae bacterium]